MNAPVRAGATRALTMPLLLGVSLLVAAGLTLGKVRLDHQVQLGSAGGYTWSLSLWFLPIAVLLVWFIRRHDQVIQRPAFWTTLIALTATAVRARPAANTGGSTWSPRYVLMMCQASPTSCHPPGAWRLSPCPCPCPIRIGLEIAS